jgi:GAF domain-containing protein
VSDRSTAASFAKVSEQLTADFAERTTLQRICQQALTVVPGCDYASLTVRTRGGRFATMATTAPEAEDWDQAQYDLGEGPCVEALTEQEVFKSDDLETDPRWPRWAAAMSHQGVHSMVSVRLTSRTEVLGGINLYGRARGSFVDDAYDLALIYAVHASIAMQASRTVSGLQTALGSRHQIGLAQGILMERYGLSIDRAFETLARLASTSNTKLRDVAARVVEGKELPPGPTEHHRRPPPPVV